MSRPAKAVEENLRRAMSENDPVLLRSLIVTTGDMSLLESHRAFNFATDGGDPYKILMPADPDFHFILDKAQWSKKYFFSHTQKMMRNFSREAFEHYLEVGKEVFPEKMKPFPEIDDSQPTVNPSSLPPRATVEEKSGVYWVKVGAAIVGFLLLGVIIWLITRE